MTTFEWSTQADFEDSEQVDNAKIDNDSVKVLLPNSFTEVGSDTWDVPASLDTIGNILIVGGGGGGGGGAYGGGGGAGGLVFEPDYDLSGIDDVSITVGEGGDGGEAQSTDGTNGGDSSFADLIALGGGYGTARDGSAEGGDGGSGGGVGWSNGETPGDGIQPDTNTGGFGHKGADEPGGGGGGAGEPGPEAMTSSPWGGDGADGLYEVTIDGITYNFADIFGTDYGEIIDDEAWFAGGGASAGRPYEDPDFVGGRGGGGDEGPDYGDGLPGTENTGGGGAGGGYDGDNHRDGADGGSGIVIIGGKNATIVSSKKSL